MSDKQLPLELPPFKPDEEPPLRPEWLGSVTAAQRRNAGLGLHPTGRPLGPEGRTCGSCAHATTVILAGRYHKCLLDRPNWTRGPGTDIRLKWRCCDQYSAVVR